MDPQDQIKHYYSKGNNKPYIGKNVKLGRNVYIDYFCYIGENCTIGDNVKLGFGAYIGDNCIVGHNTEISPHAVLFPKSIVGCWSKIGASCIINGASIGNYVTLYYMAAIGLDVVIEDHVFVGPRLACTNTREIRHGRTNVDVVTTPARINFGARIGGGVTLLPGVIIGREALIGAGSVITKSIGDFKVAYGNPAKEVREIDPSQKISEKIYKDYITKREQRKILHQSHRLSLLNAVKIILTEIYSMFINIS
jgi:UDP-2-acetamido-3-amino-2,3-dideoxy-glucuronate N-acetyltransferase